MLSWGRLRTKLNIGLHYCENLMMSDYVVVLGALSRVNSDEFFH